MLLTNRRHRLLHMAIAGMEIGWIAPWALLLFNFWHQRLDSSLLSDGMSANTAAALKSMITVPPLLFYFTLFGTMLLYMIAADLLNRRQIGFPLRETIMLALVAGTSLLAVRVILYPTLGLSQMIWLRNTFTSLFDFTAGRRPEVALLLINGFLWLRVAVNTDRDLTFFRVTLSFRLGLLIAIAGNALLLGLNVQPLSATLVYFALFLITGLTAIAIARTDEKAYTVDSSRGSLLPWSRVAQMLLVGGLVVVIGLATSLVFTPGNLRGLILWFSPLWRLLGAALNNALFALAWALAPLMEWMINTIRQWMESRDPLTPPPPPSAGEFRDIVITPTDITEYLNRMVYVRYTIIVLMIIAVLFVIWFFFVRSPHRYRENEEEELRAERVTLGGSLFGRGLDRLRNLADLIRRYGIGTQLLAAISIQNIYANVSRLALARGYPRHLSQPPDVYLSDLVIAFPDCADELARITDAYMRVEYGDQSLADLELASLQEDYRRIQDAPLLDHAEGYEATAS